MQNIVILVIVLAVIPKTPVFPSVFRFSLLRLSAQHPCAWTPGTTDQSDSCLVIFPQMPVLSEIYKKCLAQPGNLKGAGRAFFKRTRPAVFPHDPANPYQHCKTRKTFFPTFVKLYVAVKRGIFLNFSGWKSSENTPFKCMWVQNHHTHTELYTGGYKNLSSSFEFSERKNLMISAKKQGQRARCLLKAKLIGAVPNF